MVYNVGRDFALTNPNGVWSYGYQSAIGAPFNLLASHQVVPGDNGVPILLWHTQTAPAIYANTNDTAATSGGEAYPPHTAWCYAGPEGSDRTFAVMRFTVPANGAGSYLIASAVAPRISSGGDDSDFHVARNGVELFGQFLDATQSGGYTNVVALQVGDTIDLLVGRGANGRLFGSGLKLQVSINRLAYPPLPPVNHAPLAKALVVPLFDLWTDEATRLVISGNGVNAKVNLDGSLSSDADGDALQHVWAEQGQAGPFAAGVLATNRFELGEHTIVLVVDDGRATGSDAVTIEVITLSGAVEELLLFVAELDFTRKEKRELLATLNRVWDSFEEGRLSGGVKQLRAFQQKIRAHLLKVKPDAGRKLIDAADQVIDVANAAMDDDGGHKHPGTGKK